MTTVGLGSSYGHKMVTLVSSVTPLDSIQAGWKMTSENGQPCLLVLLRKKVSRILAICWPDLVRFLLLVHSPGREMAQPIWICPNEGYFSKEERALAGSSPLAQPLFSVIKQCLKLL